ncbi:MAG TPA: ATP-binding cassette domain-containing protein [Candidatus Limiplasma sp.]|nr:ATP-binding cassette domain-containing protein [Candidatus Limiplasma sp.]
MENSVEPREPVGSLSQEASRPQIEIRNLRKVYPIPEGELVALDSISLTVDKGDIYGIIGMSGAGKSTLIRCLNRLDNPSDGEIFIDGHNILAMSQPELRATRRRMAMIFQQFNLLMQKTVAKNVRYPLEIAGMPKKQANERVMELLRLVGLEQKAAAYPSQLSGGQKQRVAIARALASDPEMLLCDEATSALDPMTTQSILALLQEINRNMGITVVLITHEMAVIRQICNKVAILDGGKLAEKGTVDEVFRHTKSAAGKRLFGVLPEQEENLPTEPALRIVFDGESAERPIISRVVRESGVDVNILSANIHQLNHKAYGQMLVALPQNLEARKRLTDTLTQIGLTVEEVYPQ